MSRSSTPLPAPRIVQALVARFGDPVGVDANASSHWRQYSGLATIEADADGMPTRLEGAGFGDLQARARFMGSCAAASLAAGLLTGPDRLTSASNVPTLLRVLSRMGLRFSQDGVRQLRTMAFLRDHLAGSTVRRILIIGDGYGVLASLLKAVYPAAHLTLIDLGRTLIFQSVFCQRAHPEARHALVGDAETANEADFTYCFAGDTAQLSGDYDLAVNVASMQEMTPESVRAYFGLMRARRVTHFYCCNREHKVLPGGEVSEFESYPWRAEDIHVVDEPCPWHQWFLGPPWQSDGPRIFGVRVPLANYFDGRHRHRLTRLAPQE